MDRTAADATLTLYVGMAASTIRICSKTADGITQIHHSHMSVNCSQLPSLHSGTFTVEVRLQHSLSGRTQKYGIERRVVVTCNNQLEQHLLSKLVDMLQL